MRYLLIVFGLLAVMAAAPGFATNGGELVAAHEQIVTDVYMDLNAVNAAHQVDQLVEMCNQYANQRQVVLNVHHQNGAQVVNAVRVRRVAAVRRNVRLVFVANRRVVQHQNQVRVVVRARRGVLFNALFNRGFFAADRVRAQRVISVRVRG